MGKEAQKGSGITASSHCPPRSLDRSGIEALSRVSYLMALAALAGAMILWSVSYIAMKVALTAFHPVFVIMVRMAVSFLILLPFLGGWLRNMPYRRGDWRILLLLVVSEPCLFFLFEGYGLRYTSASQAAVVLALMPLCVAVSASILLKERIGPAAWTGFFVTMGGVVWLTLAGSQSVHAPRPLLGNSLQFLAVLAASSYTLCVRRLQGYASFSLTAIQAAGGTLFFLVLCLTIPGAFPEAFILPWSENRNFSLPLAGQPDQELAPVLALLFLSVITCLAYGLYNIGISRLSAARAAAWINLIPALTLVMGLLLLNETLTLQQYYALVPIAVGLALSQVHQRRKDGPK